MSSLEKMKEIARSRGGFCLALEYSGSKGKLPWRCEKNHEWMASPNSVSRGSWCAICAGNKRLTIDEMQEIAAGRGGLCLSDVYTDSKSNLRWRCANGHEWLASGNSIRSGSWCGRCAGVTHLTLEELSKLAHAHGGTCLTEAKRGSSSEALWRCGNGHTWEASAAAVRRGTWCPTCSGRKALTIEDMRALAETRGGRCLSSEYLGSRVALQWECENKHVWLAIPNSVRQGTWCRQCPRASRAFDAACRLAREKGGACLAEKNLGSNKKIQWQCRNGHRWDASPNTVANGHWCGICAGKTRRSLDELTAIAKDHGGTCVSTEYLGTDIPLEWRCSQNHVWRASPYRIRNGSWCPKCAGRAPGTLDEMHELAGSRGGRCVASEYVDSKTPIEWECENGHRWKAAPGNIRADHWCPQCQINYGEEICRVFMKGIFGVPFPSSWPSFLVPPDRDARAGLQLDGFNSDLMIAFEHHGIQHYTHTPRFHKARAEFDDQVARDARKRSLCEAQGVRLLVIPAVPELTAVRDLGSVIAAELGRLEITPPVDPLTLEVDYSRAFRSGRIDRLRAAAASRNGKLVSPAYLGSDVPLDWECAAGHQWSARPASVLRGTWCRICAYKGRSGKNK
jgi:hypothetical protein